MGVLCVDSMKSGRGSQTENVQNVSIRKTKFGSFFFFNFVFNVYMHLLPNLHGPRKKAPSMYYSSPAYNIIQMDIF